MTNHKYSLDKGRCQCQSGTALISDSSDGIRRNESFFQSIAVGTGTWGIAAVIPKYLSLRLQLSVF